jgi:hypothetical protein
MKNAIIILTSFLALTGCEGYYSAKGTVYQNINGNKKPLDSTIVKVYCETDWLRGTATTNPTGQYVISGLTTPAKATYTIIFERIGFKTDTVKIEGNRGKTFISLDQTMTAKR